jgi:hypothetical protein
MRLGLIGTTRLYDRSKGVFGAYTYPYWVRFTALRGHSLNELPIPERGG